MARKGRLTKQVDDAIRLLREEGSIVVPMNKKQYEASKDYKFCIMEEIHEVQKDRVNWQAQMKLYESIREELINKEKEITSLPDEGIIRLK